MIGINTAIFTATGTSAGVGFAIPVDTVAAVVPQLIAFGRVTRPTLGVQIANAAVASKLHVTHGALIQSVTPGSAAERAGLLPTRRGLAGILPGDAIIGIGGSPVAGAADVDKALDRLAVGASVEVRVLRSEGAAEPAELAVNVVLGQEQ